MGLGSHGIETDSLGTLWTWTNIAGTVPGQKSLTLNLTLNLILNLTLNLDFTLTLDLTLTFKLCFKSLNLCLYFLLDRPGMYQHVSIG